jgi:multidrug efflux pump subunit AcrB
LWTKPLAFVAILGVLALNGMIARNSVILIDQIKKEDAKDFIIETRSSRRP